MAWYYGQGVVGNGDVHATTSCMVVLVGLVSGGLACYWWREEGWRVGGRAEVDVAGKAWQGRTLLLDAEPTAAGPAQEVGELPARGSASEDHPSSTWNLQL